MNHNSEISIVLGAGEIMAASFRSYFLLFCSSKSKVEVKADIKAKRRLQDEVFEEKMQSGKQWEWAEVVATQATSAPVQAPPKRSRHVAPAQAAPQHRKPSKFALSRWWMAMEMTCQQKTTSTGKIVRLIDWSPLSP